MANATKPNWVCRIGLAFCFMLGFGGAGAFAHTTRHGSHTHIAHTHIAHTQIASAHGHAAAHLASARHHRTAVASRYRRHRHYASAHYRYSGLQCVPYAREVSHIELSGNAFLWWAEAAGRYARGDAPVEGAVLNFRSIRRMPLGHVAVVTAVLDSRTVMVTQANWIRGTITNDVTVQDVSPDNDWSQVQVELGDTPTLGASYPTYGFIYDQPANSTVIANNAGQGGSGMSTEVAEAPRAVTLPAEAPDRNLQ